MARVDAAHVAPNFLAMTIEIIEHVSADRDIVKFLQQAELGQFADRVRQGVDADPELADGVGLFEQFTSDAAGAKHQRRGQTTDTATDDNYFHRLNSTQPALSAHETRGERAQTACHSAYSAASGFVASPFSSARVFGLALILSSSRSCRSLSLLRKIWSLPGRYCGGQNT